MNTEATNDDKKAAAARAVLVAAAKFGAVMLDKVDDGAAAALGAMAKSGTFSVVVADALSPKPGVRLSWTSPSGDTVILGAIEFTFRGGAFMPAGRLN